MTVVHPDYAASDVSTNGDGNDALSTSGNHDGFFGSGDVR